MERIGVRELRQHASRYLAQVVDGASFAVTDRGRSVAMLVPMPSDRWQQMLASGMATPQAIEGDILDEQPMESDVDASGILAAMREPER